MTSPGDKSILFYEKLAGESKILTKSLLKSEKIIKLNS